MSCIRISTWELVSRHLVTSIVMATTIWRLFAEKKQLSMPVWKCSMGPTPSHYARETCCHPWRATFRFAAPARTTCRQDYRLSGLLDVTAGDFDGDRHMDLAVGETERTVMNATGQVLDHDARGHLYVYWSVEDRGSELRLADADVVVDGEAAFDQFGRLPSAPGLDLNGDHYADLIVGASMSHVVGTPTLSNAGKMYFLPGGPRQFALPPLSSMPVLSNNPFTGSGDFADGTRGTVLDQVPLDSDNGKGLVPIHHARRRRGRNLRPRRPGISKSRRSLFVNPIDALAVSPASIDYTSPTFTLSGSNQAELIMELDLAGLLPNIAELGTDDDRLASLTLQLDYFNLHVQQGRSLRPAQATSQRRPSPLTNDWYSQPSGALRRNRASGPRTHSRPNSSPRTPRDSSSN